jgi:hypothetical protein
MRRCVVVIGVLSLMVIAWCAVAAAQAQPVPPTGQERMRDVSQQGTQYLSLILSVFLVLLGPAIVVWIICRIVRLEEVGFFRSLFAAIVGFLAALLLFYGVKPLTDALLDVTLFYKNTELGLRAGVVILISFIVFLFLMRASLIRAIIFTVFYTVSLYVAAWLAYSRLLESTGATELLKTSQ